ncbi:MAG: 2-hydroxyacid dehydrogenase [Nocardioidaceae bacterium]
MRVFLPFPAETLAHVPEGFQIEVVDATEMLPASVVDVEFYVPAYRFSERVVEVIAEMPRLKVVQSLTAGVEHITPHLRPGTTLCNAAGVHDAATSELAIGLMISAQRRLAELSIAQRDRYWDLRMTRSLADQRVLVIGAGHIGRALQRRLDGFECEVTMVGRSARPGVRSIAELRELLPAADIVVLIVPLTEETRGMVNRAFLAQLRDGALLVNVARGPIVVTDDLMAEVSTGRLRAALDVTDPEPLPAEHPLWSMPEVIITPHVGGAAESLWPRAHALVSEQLQRFSDGKPLMNVVS